MTPTTPPIVMELKLHNSRFRTLRHCAPTPCEERSSMCSIYKRAVARPPRSPPQYNVGRRPVHCGWRTPPRNLKPNGMLSSADGARRPTQCALAKVSASFVTTVTTWHVKTWRVAEYFPCGHTLFVPQKRNNTHILIQQFNSTLDAGGAGGFPSCIEHKNNRPPTR